MLFIRTIGRRLASATNNSLSNPSTTNQIYIKDSCLNRLKSILGRPKEEYLRIHVETGGCSGFSYSFEIEQNKSLDLEEDLIFNREQYRVVINKDVLPFMKGSSIDYNESLIKSSFTVENPLAETKCGCGASFSINPNKLN